jgi:hypothetical protein
VSERVQSPLTMRAVSRRDLVWHYTAGNRLPTIVRSGVLRPGVTVRGEWPAVWFSRRRDWDPAVGLTGLAPEIPREMALRAAAMWLSHGPRAAIALLYSLPGRALSPRDVGGLVRIGVAPQTAPFTWDAFVRLGGVAPLDAQVRTAYDGELGSNPEDWQISLVPVPAAAWLAVEWRSGTRAGERWGPIAT